MKFIKFDMVEGDTTKPQNTFDPHLNAVTKTSQDMKDTLNRSDLPDEEKVKHHNQQMIRKQKYFDQYTDGPSVPDAEQPDLVKKQLLEFLPPSLKNKGELLLEHIKMSGIPYTPEGELIVNGEPLQGTNVAVLLDDMLRRRKTNAPYGWREMRDLLETTNIPPQFIGNTARYRSNKRKRMESESSDDEFEDTFEEIDERPEWLLQKYKSKGFDI